MYKKEKLHTTEKPKTRVLIIKPYLTKEDYANKEVVEYELQETKNLCKALDNLEVVHADTCLVKKVQHATLFGQGMVDDIHDLGHEREIDMAFVDYDLSPIQQRNLEKAWEMKVIDRSGFIIEIFGKRANTFEGRLQVKLAKLMYDKSRLVRVWTHLERQRGGGGFTGGPGEKQLELDKRIISEKIINVKKRISQVKKTRELQRGKRDKVPYKILSLVGYTNAGKSSLFNLITHSDIFVKDMLFATLDNTIRKIKINNGEELMVSDTVGFISNLPHDLIEAFSATLEEAVRSDIILNVRDVSSPNFHEHNKQVYEILSGLGITADTHKIIELWNKVDLLSEEKFKDLEEVAKNSSNKNTICISVLNNYNIEQLKNKIFDILYESAKEISFKIPTARGDIISYISTKSKILDSDYGEEYTTLKVLMVTENIDKSKSKFGDILNIINN